MGIQKKHGKGRLDKWYKLAKEKNYRARSAFKLIQLNQKYGFLQKSRVLIDLCAAPGGWLQVAAENMPNSSLIVGVDLAPIKPIPKVITFVSDITTDKCRSTLRQHLKTWKADTVLHDGAPNVGTAWVQDAFTQAELALQSLKLAMEFLVEGGTFVTKIFRSKDYNSLLWVFNQLFKKVEATKPPSSRNVSAEIFVVCRGYLAPKRVDPKFLDPKTVFEELPDATPNNEAKVYNPEKKKRKRDGYEEGDNLLYKEIPVKEFIETTDPIALLGSMNKFTFTDKNDIATATIIKMPETTQEIRNCCDDLRVLGRRDFKILLKWRLAIRDKFGWSTKKKKEAEEEEAAEGEEEAEITPMDEELKLEEDLKNMKEKETKKKKKEKKRENERKQKEIVRLQMHMTAPMEIGLEQQAGPGDDQSMFKLKAVDAAGALNQVVKGKMNMVVDEEEAKARAAAAQQDEDESEESDDAEDALEDELDRMYEQYVEKKAERDDKFKAKRARKEGADDEWEGIDENKDDATSDEDVVLQDDDDDDSSSEDEDEESGDARLVTSLDSGKATTSGLSKKAALFFDQDIFKEFGDIGADVAGTEEESDGEDEEVDLESGEEEVTSDNEEETSEHESSSETIEDADEWFDTRETAESEDDDVSDSGIEIVPSNKDDMWDANEKDHTKNGKPDIDIITAEAMTLAQQIALGKKSKADLIDDGFNKYSFRSKDGLPDWFLEDEAKHSKPLRPITAAGAAAIKEKLRALNARPIKKVKEAKDRKKFKAHQRLEKLRKKSAMLMEEEGMTEKEKAQKITRMINRATKKKPKQSVKLVVARGKGLQGRPRGVKGKYKVVDARMKKDKSRIKKKK
ncbi:AdoMet-dependent rRNA methyltransferase spb1 [Orbilia ellipsospora]|uniref:AdoMet-dependent rRNA methyltransferase spb1 n=1 Tax=Orbilia ellipsospora TaxID=2528407 RepID=A0AAV9X292_9PEZI